MSVLAHQVAIRRLRMRPAQGHAARLQLAALLRWHRRALRALKAAP